MFSVLKKWLCISDKGVVKVEAEADLDIEVKTDSDLSTDKEAPEDYSSIDCYYCGEKEGKCPCQGGPYLSP